MNTSLKKAEAATYHDDHGDDHGDDTVMTTVMTGEGMCRNTATHENYESTEEECANTAVWTEEDDHGEGMCHNTATHGSESTEEDCASRPCLDGPRDHDLPEIHEDQFPHTFL